MLIIAITFVIETCNMLKHYTLAVLLLLSSSSSFAQKQWLYLPNNGFAHDTSYRIEDIYFTDTTHGFAVTLNDGLFRTTDGGRNWNMIDVFYTQFRAIEFLNDGTTGIAGTLNNIGTVFHTTDSGKSWNDISQQIPDTNTLGTRRICGLTHWGDNFYGVGWWGAKQARFYKSADKGVSWQTVYIDTNLATSLVDVHFTSADTGFVTGTRENKNKPSASVILKTTDRGNSWNEVFSDTVLSGLVWKIQFVTDDYAVGAIQNLFFRDSVNMVRSKNGGSSWEIIPVGNKSGTLNRGGSTQACGFATPAKGWVGGYYDGIFETTDSGKTWSYINFGSRFNRIFVIDSNHVFAGGNMPYRYGYPFGNSVQNIFRNEQIPHNLYPITPNPAKGSIKIEFDLDNETNVVLNVVCMDSKKIYPVANTHLSKGHYTYYWDGSQAPAGNYFLWMGNNEIPLTQKFVLLK